MKAINFKITGIEVHGFSTEFTITENGDSGTAMSPQAMIHTIGEHAGLSLKEIEGLEFTVIINPKK